MSEILPSKWVLESDNLHSDCRIFEVHKRRFRRISDGVSGDFFVLDTNDWVNVLAVTPAQKLVLVRQFRYGTEEFSLEPPGGVIESGEDPIMAGLRELKEETGYIGTDAELIGTARPNAAILSNRCYFVFVKNVERTADLAFDEHEELITELHSVKDLRGLVANNEVTHSIGLNAILKLMIHLDM
jgi:8-oxo-dGTP pyrophosphatase MutT (NUDIX family)